MFRERLGPRIKLSKSQHLGPWKTYFELHRNRLIECHRFFWPSKIFSQVEWHSLVYDNSKIKTQFSFEKIFYLNSIIKIR